MEAKRLSEADVKTIRADMDGKTLFEQEASNGRVLNADEWRPLYDAKVARHVPALLDAMGEIDAIHAQYRAVLGELVSGGLCITGGLFNNPEQTCAHCWAVSEAEPFPHMPDCPILKGQRLLDEVTPDAAADAVGTDKGGSG